MRNNNTDTIGSHKVLNDMEIIGCRSPYQSAIIRTEAVSAMEQFLEGPLAEWVRSRMAGSEHSTSKTPGLAERPLSGNLDGRNGHNPEVA